MKTFFLILSVLCTTSLYAQRMTVVDITNIMQYVNDDSLTYQVAVSESFANSDHGRELLKRVERCELCAAKNNGIRTVEKINAHDYGKDVDKKLNSTIADLQQAKDQGMISAEDFAKYKAEYEKLFGDMKDAVTEQKREYQRNPAKNLYSEAELKMPEDPDALVKELFRYAAGGQYYREVRGMGKGMACVTNGKPNDYTWGVINLFNQEIFPQKYLLRGYTATNDLLVLEKEGAQYGLFHYNGECVIPFQKNEMQIKNYHALMHTSSGDKVIDKNGKTLFSYPIIIARDGMWEVQYKPFNWGVVADDGTILIPLKYGMIWKWELEGTEYVGAFYKQDSFDCDLYDPKTWELVGKHIRGEIIMNKK